MQAVQSWICPWRRSTMSDESCTRDSRCHASFVACRLFYHHHKSCVCERQEWLCDCAVCLPHVAYGSGWARMGRLQPLQQWLARIGRALIACWATGTASQPTASCLLLAQLSNNHKICACYAHCLLRWAPIELHANWSIDQVTRVVLVANKWCLGAGGQQGWGLQERVADRPPPPWPRGWGLQSFVQRLVFSDWAVNAGIDCYPLRSQSVLTMSSPLVAVSIQTLSHGFYRETSLLDRQALD